MPLTNLLLVLTIMSLLAYRLGRRRSIVVVGGRSKQRELHSLPSFYGRYALLWCVLPGVALLLVWLTIQQPLAHNVVRDSLSAQGVAVSTEELGLLVNDVRNVAAGNIASDADNQQVRVAADAYLAYRKAGNWWLTLLVFASACAGTAWALWRITPVFQARNAVERVLKTALIASSTIAIFTTIGILLSVLFEAMRFFAKVPLSEFMFGLNWSPQTSIRADQVGSSGAFGAVPLFAGTLLISLIAMLVAAPLGLMSAIYLSEYATRRIRAVVKPVLEVLAGIPTVVYGFFAALTVAPILRDIGGHIGLEVASESALGAGLVMGVMIIPFVSSLSDDVINAVPQAMRDGSLALGATRSETIRRVVLPAALPGIIGGMLLAVSRAIGETMIVVMAAGLAANLTANPLEAVTTVTVQIVTLLVGDQEFDSAKTLAAFALGLLLFVVTLVLNVIALRVVRRYREQYE